VPEDVHNPHDNEMKFST